MRSRVGASSGSRLSPLCSGGCADEEGDGVRVWGMPLLGLMLRRAVAWLYQTRQQWGWGHWGWGGTGVGHTPQRVPCVLTLGQGSHKVAESGAVRLRGGMPVQVFCGRSGFRLQNQLSVLLVDFVTDAFRVCFILYGSILSHDAQENSADSPRMWCGKVPVWSFPKMCVMGRT